MKRTGWMPVCLACVAALIAAGCQPSATGEGAGTTDAPKAGQTAAGQPVAEGMATTVLHAKGMH